MRNKNRLKPGVKSEWLPGAPQLLCTVNVLQCTLSRPTVTPYTSLLLFPGDMNTKFIALSALFPQNHAQALKVALVVWGDVAWLPLGLKQSHRRGVLIAVSPRLPAAVGQELLVSFFSSTTLAWALLKRGLKDSSEESGSSLEDFTQEEKTQTIKTTFVQLQSDIFIWTNKTALEN